MSSNIKIQKICHHCGNEFTARTTTTLYCSHKCNSAALKAKIRAAKIEVSNTETQLIKTKPIAELKSKEFLSVSEVSKLIGCSRQTVYSLINSGKLKATNILEKKTIVKRIDLDNLFELPKREISEHENIPEPTHYEITDCYNLTETLNKYGISEKALHELIKRNSIPKIKKGRFAYVPKIIIDKLLR